LASFRARLTLLGSCLSGITSYYTDMFLLNKTFIKKMDKIQEDSSGLARKTKEGTIW
jgi:hypothetical protein